MSKPTPTEMTVRCYTEVPSDKPVGSKPASKRLDAPSRWTLVFDCETSTDAAQRLKVGFFQVRENGTLRREGLFFDAEAVTDSEIATILAYAEAKGLESLTIETFRTEVFLKVGYHWGGCVIGFHLPFDISRIAMGHTEARRGSMRGGFSFRLTENPYEPRVRVKHLSRRAALIDFSVPAKQQTPRGMRERGRRVPHCRGYFGDVKTIAAALTSRSFSLGDLAAHLKTKTRKLATDEHGGPITDSYLDYARADVQTTWECYQVLAGIYTQHGLETPIHRILSEASIGKAYLKQMGIQPLLACQPDIDRTIFGKIMCAYYGGRAEVRIRREIREVRYADFKSMYPTVNSLMGLWDFVIADGMTWHDSTLETQAFLHRVSVADMQRPDAWRKFRTLVRLKPDQDILPIRARYDGKVNTIGLNYLSSSKPLWFTLADCLVSKLLSGKMPIIEEAISFVPGPPQKDLRPVDLFGDPAYRVDPLEHDVFNRLIDLRDAAKIRKDDIEKAIKIIANATSYGIFIEVQRDDAPKPEPLNIYGPDGNCFSFNSKALEQPGKYFNPLLAVLITGAARLMLAIAEAIALENELEWVFCDTDSIAIAKPKDMSRDLFLEKTKLVIDWFIPLNPYQKPGSILQIEDINHGNNENVLEPLYCFAISAKRYCLFNIDKFGKPILRKASAHGLGHLMEPYSSMEALPESPKPKFPLTKIGVKRWQHDFWLIIIDAALEGKPDQVPLDWHTSLQKPAVSRYVATSPDLLAWMRHWNEGKPYSGQIRPFGFLVAPMARKGLFSDLAEPEMIDPHRRGRPSSYAAPKPIAPFAIDLGAAVSQAFDRVTGDAINLDQLKSYAEALFNYHLSSEDKFENAEFLERGVTERRHVLASRVILIGKEANKVDVSGVADPASASQSVYSLG